MTERVRIEHTFPCSEETFWSEIFFDETYNSRMYLEALKFPLWRIVSSEDKGAEVLRVVECEPALGDLPAPMKKVVGDGLRYREEGRYEKQSRVYHVRVVPSVLADKMSVVGKLYTQRVDDTHCKRVFEAEVTVKVFGIGGMIEKRIASDLDRSYDAGARFTVKYLENR